MFFFSTIKEKVDTIIGVENQCFLPVMYIFCIFFLHFAHKSKSNVYYSAPNCYLEQNIVSKDE